MKDPRLDIVRKDPNLRQPLTYPGGIWSYEDYPAYKTDKQIVFERMKRYYELVGFGGGTYQDINDKEIQEYFDEYAYDGPLKSYPGPWRWIALLAVAVCFFLINYCEHNGI